LAFEALLPVLETGLLGNAVCKAEEVVEVDRAVAEESFLEFELLEQAFVGSVQDCALLCKNSDLFGSGGLGGLYCIGFRFRALVNGDGDALWGLCLLLFEDNGSYELGSLLPSGDTEKYYSIAGCL
jgi:hypothetical protein